MPQSWNDEKIEQALREMSADIGHFPSCLEMRDRSRNDLACAVSKSGGFMMWAERLGISRQDSDSDFGWRGEVCVCGLFRNRRHSAERTAQVKAPFDLLVDDVLRVDVKNAVYAEYRKLDAKVSTGWFYRLGKIPQADLIFLYQYDTGEFYGLPWFVCPSGNITISKAGGKYAQYKCNWPLIEDMIRVRKAERDLIFAPQLAVAS